MTTEEIKALAVELARAQLLAGDEMVDTATAEWPDEFKSQIPPVGSQATQAERVEAYRKVRLAAEAAIAEEKRQDALTAELLEQGRLNAARELAQWEQEDAARFRLELAQWEAERLKAEANGRPFERDRPRPARTGDEMLREKTSGYLNNGF